MKEIVGELWDYHKEGVWICITTNGFVKKDGSVVMGRGCALEAKDKYPDLPYELGKALTGGQRYARFNKPIAFDKYKIITFPVKDFFKDPADLDLIKSSSGYLMRLLDEKKIDRIILPRPGCGYGHRQWEEVKPIIEEILDDRVEVISK